MPGVKSNTTVEVEEVCGDVHLKIVFFLNKSTTGFEPSDLDFRKLAL